MMDGNDANSLQTDDALKAVPLFPLPSTVFFPHTLLPLHIFEPRYRQMVHKALEHHRLIAVVMAHPTDQKIQKIAGLGRIVHHEPLPDGRSHILLQGLARVRLLQELPLEGLAFRRASVEVLHDVSTDPLQVATQAQALRSCYAHLIDAAESMKDALGDLPVWDCMPNVLADLVCSAVLNDPLVRQEALEQRCVATRLHQANAALASLLLGHTDRRNALVH